MPPRPLLLLASLATACAGQGAGDKAGDSAIVGDSGGQSSPDADGDGWSAPEDCDETDPDVNPGAEERCDGLDDDCDGEVDEPGAVGAAPGYLDGDGDGYGAGEQVELCLGAAGSAAVGGDCDDADAGISPAATEIIGDGVDEDCDGQEICYLDVDSDGARSESTRTSLDADCDDDHEAGADAALDCDDQDAAIHPEATEIPGDGVDEDCDGTEICYADDDLDGARSSSYGASSTDLSCGEPGMLSADAEEDCDDSDGEVHAGATEIVDDGVDEDCDGLEACYTDTDGDGYRSYRSAEVPDLDCSAAGEATAATPNGDCDDDDASRYPGADEVVGDGIDEDCDGHETCYADVDDDGYRTTSHRTSFDEDCDDSGEALLSDPIEDCDDTDDSTYPGAAEVCDDGVINDCDGDAEAAIESCTFLSGDVSLAYADMTFEGDAGEGTGRAVAGVGDVNGDGLDDLIVGAPYADTAATDAGSAWLLLGPVTGVVTPGDADATLTGAATGDDAGDVLCGAGDRDGDGYDDLVLGVPDADGSVGDGGATYVIFGPVTGARSLGDADAALYGDASGSDSGGAVSGGGDVDGDGLPDLLIGDYAYPSGAYGTAWLVSGPLSGALELADVGVQLSGPERYDRAGWSVAEQGDLDGDGLADLLVGIPFLTFTSIERGGVAVLHGPVSEDQELMDADAMLLGGRAFDQAGRAVAIAPDVDGDGNADILVASYEASLGGTESGGAWLWTEDAEGFVSLSDATALIEGPSAYDYVGDAVAGVGDTDGDGLGDLLIGAESLDVRVSSNGAAYLLFGPVSGDVDLGSSGVRLRILGEEAYDYAGSSVAGAGDTDADGLSEVLIGARGAGAAGEVYRMSPYHSY